VIGKLSTGVVAKDFGSISGPLLGEGGILRGYAEHLTPKTSTEVPPEELPCSHLWFVVFVERSESGGVMIPGPTPVG